MFTCRLGRVTCTTPDGRSGDSRERPGQRVRAQGQGLPTAARAQGGARPQLGCVVAPPAALPAQERLGVSWNPKFRRSQASPASLGWPRRAPRGRWRRPALPLALQRERAVGRSQVGSRSQHQPAAGCAHRACDFPRLRHRAGLVQGGRGGQPGDWRWPCSAISRLPGAQHPGHSPASQRGPSGQGGEGASAGTARCPEDSAFSGRHVKKPSEHRRGSRQHGTFQTLECCNAVTQSRARGFRVQLLARPGHRSGRCW